MKKTSFFLGVFICFITLGCSKQGAMDLQSLEDAYFEVAQNTVDEPLSVVELTEMLSNYAPKEMVDGNQKIYTFATDNGRVNGFRTERPRGDNRHFIYKAS